MCFQHRGEQRAGRLQKACLGTGRPVSQDSAGCFVSLHTQPDCSEEKLIPRLGQFVFLWYLKDSLLISSYDDTKCTCYEGCKCVPDARDQSQGQVARARPQSNNVCFLGVFGFVFFFIRGRTSLDS